jgi:hypothetical protein
MRADDDAERSEAEERRSSIPADDDAERSEAEERRSSIPADVGGFTW